jgi:hypothetical protein
MKNTIVRVNATADFPGAAYMRSVGKDGDFAITTTKEKARRFTPERASEVIARAARHTLMTFDTCEVSDANA